MFFFTVPEYQDIINKIDDPFTVYQHPFNDLLKNLGSAGVSESTIRRIVDDDEYFTREGSLYNDIDKLVISVRDDSSSESEESEMDQFNYAGASGNISEVE
ncbi:unnamed protein product [Parnassius mnemosyne]|uniref:Uncharacterized protein n=1 Tax=Parnassius mnemosyne TaxID=213953 RepID=A0AAV1LF13_9NEOP